VPSRLGRLDQLELAYLFDPSAVLKVSLDTCELEVMNRYKIAHALKICHKDMDWQRESIRTALGK
jgi:hypothetical protein